MMKVRVLEAGDRLILQVEGRLAGAFVPELENCWRTVRAGRPDGPISVDLKRVTCIDGSGQRLLRQMHTQGAVFTGAGLATQDILDQVMEPQK